MSRRSSRHNKDKPSTKGGRRHTDDESGITSWSPIEPAKEGAPHTRTRKRDPHHKKKDKVEPQNVNQAILLESMAKDSMIIAAGPAGTGKTFLAVSAAVEALESGRVDRIVLSRPAVESGESLGFLPGSLEEKMAPYLRPLYDTLNDRFGVKRLKNYMADGIIEIAPIAYMRGRTLNNSFVVIDEAQNCTYTQLKMLLTRLGWHSTMVFTGDPDQSDLLGGLSGLSEIAQKLDSVTGVSVVELTERDIVRHPLVASMLSVL